MKDKLFLFGLGTGRCGTVSLAKLLNAQWGALVTHEQRPWMPWKLNKEAVRIKVASLEERNSNIVGDVALFYLQSVEALLEYLPEAKFVVLKRDQNKTVDSFKQKWKPKYNRFRHKKKEWDNVFPYYKHEGMSLEDDVNMYYAGYYAKAFVLQEKYPNNVKCFNTQVLNDKKGVELILDFCRIPSSYRVRPVGIRANKGNRA